MFRHKSPLLFLCLLAVAIASCNKSNIKPVVTGKNLVLSAPEQQKAAADNVFTLRLFKNLDQNNTAHANLFASPLSVSFVLGMTSNGAAGQTLDAIRNTLNFAGLTQEEVNAYYNNLITNLPQLDPNTTLKIANSIWYRQEFNVLPDFLNTNASYFKAEVKGLDFNAPSSVQTINNWVNSQTGGKIPSIVETIPDDAVMYLVNAIYFKSGWKEKFDPKNTTKRPFNLESGGSVQADFMDNTMNVNSYQDDDVTVTEIPYSGGTYSMVIALPKKADVSTLIASIDSARWQAWMNGLLPGKLEIQLPKFRFSYEVKLNDALSTLGMGIAFTKAADFSRINSAVPLMITAVKHKAFVEVNEDGTTAAAATSVEIGATAAPLPQVIRFDRPFFFAIREMKSGLIVFAGVVNDPTK
ncbi:MAG TPA: serpin family protein [Mucilaginibacter sp.]|nr:serpin family protein [Mucilaginibacter sp.]